MITSRGSKTLDETLVWFTSMGLAVGLSMVIFLLVVVCANGAAAFWPKRVVLIEGDRTKTLAGEVNKENARETQLYLGNKEAYGLAFQYVKRDGALRVSHPKDILMIERMEYGDAIGFPVALEIKGVGRLEFIDPRFDETLGSLVKEAAERRAEIRNIEKNEIGAINRQMENLRLREKTGDRGSWIVDRKTELQARYEVLAAKSRKLRAEQKENFLVYRLAGGEERKLATGQIVHTYYPNRLRWPERLGLSFRNFWLFLTDEPREANTEGGIFPAIFGTFVMTLLMSAAVMPFGVLAAIYLREYAKEGWLVRTVRVAVNNLAGVPSIVFGVFGLGFFVYFVGGTIDTLFFKAALPTPTFGTGGIMWASLTLALMTVPVVIVASEEALAAVSRGVREGSLACGASKWQTIRHVVLPASAPGILTGLILAMARGAGEVAPLMLVGVVKLAPTLPLDSVFPFIHLDRKFMHMGFHIYDLGFQSPDSEAAKPMVFATTFLLILLVVVLNLTAIVLRERLRKKYAVGAF
jgi:phosphate transport system permease protein